MTETEAVRQFGTNGSGEDAIERPGAYGIAFDEDRVFLVQWEGNFYLPGGALESGERPEAALRREILEGTGYEVLRWVPSCTARQYVTDERSGRVLNKMCAFFRIRLGPQTGHPARGHEPRWVDIDEADYLLAEEASKWALKEATAAR